MQQIYSLALWRGGFGLFLLSGCSTLGGAVKHLEGTMALRQPLQDALSATHAGDVCKSKEPTHNHTQTLYQFTVRHFYSRIQPHMPGVRRWCPVNHTAETKWGRKCMSVPRNSHTLSKVNETNRF